MRWIAGTDTDPARLNLTRDTKWVQDFRGKNLLLFGGEWCIAWTLKQNPGLELEELAAAEPGMKNDRKPVRTFGHFSIKRRPRTGGCCLPPVR